MSSCRNAATGGLKGGRTVDGQRPIGLTVACIPRGTAVLFGVTPINGNHSIYEAELRVWLLPDGPASVDLRTPVERGTFEHNGTDKFIITKIPTSWAGKTYSIDFGAQ